MFLCCLNDQEVDQGPERFKMVIIGDGGCGKTCLLYRFSSDIFFSRHGPTVFEVQSKTAYYKNQLVELVMYDTAGQEGYDCLRHFSYRDSDVIVICFALDNPDSLDNVLVNWMPEVRYYCGNVPIILVGNKKDTRDTLLSCADPLDDITAASSFTTKLCVQALQYGQGLAVARKIDAVGYYETSAKTEEGIDTVFEAVVRASMETKLKKSTGLFRMKKP